MSQKLRQGWILFNRTCEYAGIQFTKHSIEFVLLETNKLVGSNPHVILTRQTCRQRSNRVAGSTRRALAFYFSVRIWYMFFISQFRGKSDLGLCMTSVLAKRMPLCSADFQPNTFFNRKSALCGRTLFASTEVMHRPRSDSPLHVDIQNTNQIRKET